MNSCPTICPTDSVNMCHCYLTQVLPAIFPGHDAPVIRNATAGTRCLSSKLISCPRTMHRGN